MSATQYLPISVVSGQIQSFVRYATRVVADGATAVSTSVTSATASFGANDVGASISGGTIPNGATIVSVTNATTVVISAAATVIASGVTLTITQTPALATPVLATALNSAFGATAGNIQTVVDNTSGRTTQAVVIAGDSQVLSVPVGTWVGFNNGTWAAYTPTALAAAFLQYFTT